MEDSPRTESDKLELVKHPINKMVDWGVFTPPADWERYSVSPEVTARVSRAQKL